MQPGDVVGGRYEILYPLAEGGFGSTFVAQDNHKPSNPRCVVKRLKPHSHNPKLFEKAKQFFFNEARNLEKLGSHSQIPELLAYFEENGDFFLVEEMIQGNTLTKEFFLGEVWNEIQICQTLYDILIVLDFIHSQDVIHRDVKPDNIIRRQSDNKLVLVDFGTVKDVLMKGQGSTTIVAGTPGYMPTEQGWGRPRFNSDIFALGMIGIQAATGLLPTAIEEDAKTGELIWTAGDHISGELATILSQMVRYHFAERYQSAAAVLEALAPLLRRYGLAPVAPAHTILANGNPPSGAPGPIPVPSPTQVSPALPMVPPPGAEPLPTVISGSGGAPADAPTDHPAISPATLNGSELPTIAASRPPDAPGLREAPPASPASLPTQVSEPSPVSSGDLREPASPSAALAAGAASPSSPQPAGWPWRNRLTLGKYGPVVAVGGLALLLTGGWLGYQGVSRFVRYQQVQRDVQQVQTAAAAADYGACVQQADAISDEFGEPYAEAQRLKSDCLLNQAKAAQADGQFDQCVQQANAIADNAAPYPEAQVLAGDCQLAQAQALAADRSFKQAIEALQGLPADHPAYGQGQTLIEGWSKEIIATATNEYQRGKLDAAVEIASAVPTGTALHGQAQTLIQGWQAEWQADEGHFNTAKAAFEKNDWSTAVNEAGKIKTAHWKKQVEEIRRRAQANLDAAQRAASAPSGSGSSDGGSYRPRPAASGSRPAAQPAPAPPSAPNRPTERPRDR